jgi:hypothetical protein
LYKEKEMKLTITKTTLSLAIAMMITTAANAAPDSARPMSASTSPNAVGAAASGLQKLNSVTVRCPANITSQATNAPSPWLPGAVLMNVQSAALTSPSAPVPQMICRYEGSGATWQIYRNIQPEFKACSPSGTTFVCTKP